MFERFGEMSSCREINELAENLLNEGDIQSLKVMAQENGIPEDYPDPTAGKAVRSAGRMPTHIYNVSCALNAVAGLHGLEIMGLRDKKTGKEWPQRR